MCGYVCMNVWVCRYVGMVYICVYVSACMCVCLNVYVCVRGCMYVYFRYCFVSLGDFVVFW